MKLTRTLAPILAIGLFSTAALAQGAHTHGHAEIEIALEQGKAFVKVEIPAEDAVGFEESRKQRPKKRPSKRPGHAEPGRQGFRL